jgi:hypothetical protein
LSDDRSEKASTRAKLGLLAEYIKRKNFSKDIDGLYTDWIRLCDGADDLITEVLRIKESSAMKVEQALSTSAAKSSFFGGVNAVKAYHDGASGPQAFGLWAAATLFGTAIDSIEKLPGIDLEQKRAIEDASARHMKTVRSVVARSRVVAALLEQQFGWVKGEAGFDISEEHAAANLRILESGDNELLREILGRIQARRPRDPFVQAELALRSLVQLGQSASPDQYDRVARDFLVAASYVPADSTFDELRAGCAYWAGFAWFGAAARQGQQLGYAAAPFPHAGDAVRAFRTALNYEPDDAEAEVNQMLSFALAASGRFSDAKQLIAQIVPLRQKDPWFAYNCACVLSVTEIDPSVAFRWLESLVKSGTFTDIGTMRKDPDLIRVRIGLREKFDDLVRVKFEWSVSWGLFSDDIVLTNLSPFPITSVALTPKITSTGYQPWTQTLTSPHVAPGATVKWNTQITSRGDEWKGTATLVTDQNRN